ncbi:TlpA family protein disulfide reductase [Holophaga foetida]|uniref:TlpA family protein disulfide reductase n=1 Tax=Holophaga foetida TaxID=35839 RepID=UPI0002475025|nr:thioredoxin domain-containing protein [Holophaga foetida]
MTFPRLSALVLVASTALSAQNSVPALDPAGLQQALKSGKWSVIEFGGPTCIPCMKMQPILGQLQQQYGNRANVRNFYVTQYLEEARKHRVMAMPTQVIFDASGKEVLRHVGFWSKDEFMAALAKAGLK